MSNDETDHIGVSPDRGEHPLGLAQADAPASTGASHRTQLTSGPDAPRRLAELTGAPLTAVFCTQERLMELVERERERIVCATCFTDGEGDASESAARGYMLGQVAMPAVSVDRDDATCEVKLAALGASVTHEYRVEPELGVVEESRFGTQRLVRLSLAKHRHPRDGTGVQGADRDRTPLRRAVFAGYSYLFRRQRREGWTALRYTNYLPGVTDVEDKYDGTGERSAAPALDGIYVAPPGQRYVSFNDGRFDAWRESGPKQLEGSTAVFYGPAGGRPWLPVCPATTLVGAERGDVIIEAWYSASPELQVTYVESSRQTPPFRYDERYGRKPPIFARGTVFDPGAGAGMIISGTASILESEVVHDPGDAARSTSESPRALVLEERLRQQLSLTIENIGFLLSERNLKPQGVRVSFTLEDLTGLRIYLKHAEHIGVAREELARILPKHVPMIVVNSDMCRPGWLLEIEGQAWRASV